MMIFVYGLLLFVLNSIALNLFTNNISIGSGCKNLTPDQSNLFKNTINNQIKQSMDRFVFFDL